MILTVLLVAAGTSWAQEAGVKLRDPDVIYVPTPQEVVDAMLAMANVSSTDVVYDLGSGDGRIPITAAQKYGARAVGIDINPQRIKEANENLAKANVGGKVKFLNQDLFETDISEATVVTLYLLPSLNLKLMPTLKKLKPGTRIWAPNGRPRRPRTSAAARSIFGPSSDGVTFGGLVAAEVFLRLRPLDLRMGHHAIAPQTSKIIQS
jgi:SAM-dependent methyltransferase